MSGYKSGTKVLDHPGVETEVGGEEYTGVTGPKIRCPLCEWTPGEKDIWVCACGHEWNTFDTGGVCPSCLHRWKTTMCLSCKAWSAHSAWYQY